MASCRFQKTLDPCFERLAGELGFEGELVVVEVCLNAVGGD